MSEQISPFVPGARVAIEVGGGYSAPMSYKEAFVEKAFKNGRFTLLNSSQQWRPSGPGHYDKYWIASETGHGRDRLRIWDDAADAEILAANAKLERYQKFTKLKREIEYTPFVADLVTDEVLDQFQIVILAIKPAEAKS